ncbi:MAG TPA: CHAD domain-containing protein, partial [Propionicimonas sp.]
MIERADEVERKYEVEPAATLPDLAGVAGVVSVGEALVHELEAVYFDTAALDLARREVTLRRRTGGSDDGWHLKLPADGDSRTEVRAALGRAVRTVPRGLREVVQALARDRALAPVAVIRTHRREVPLLGEGGVLLARVCDDDVRAERLVEPAASVRWREWEVELAGAGTQSAGVGTVPSGGTDDGGDGTALLDEVEARLVRAGAHRASVTSKLARTLDGVAMPERPGQGDPSPAGALVADVLADHLAQQLDRLILEDARLRLGEADAVHHLRIAARRIRSALTTYAPVLAPDGVDDLRAELRWLGQALSGARDAQVLRSHLDEVLAGEPEDLVLGPVRER